MFRLSMLAVSVVLVSSPVLAANCSIDPFNFKFGTDTSSHMEVKSGVRCGANLHYGGGGASAMTVSQAAANGTVSTPTLSRWEYVSRRGYTGPDRFVVNVTGESAGRFIYHGTTQIVIDVNVVP